MALRCVLVSMVACFGFGVPAPSEVDSWSASGRLWVSARSSELAALRVGVSGWLIGADPVVTPVYESLGESESAGVTGALPTPEVLSETLDHRFEAITADMIERFVLEQPDLVVQVDPPITDLDDSTTRSTHPEAEAAHLTLVHPSPSSAESGQFSISEQQRSDGVPACQRLGSAVRLTHEAVQAWVALAQSVSPESHTLR